MAADRDRAWYYHALLFWFATYQDLMYTAAVLAMLLAWMHFRATTDRSAGRLAYAGTGAVIVVCVGTGAKGLTGKREHWTLAAAQVRQTLGAIEEVLAKSATGHVDIWTSPTT